MLLVIVFAVGVVLVSPCVDGDDAIHHRSHHHHAGVEPLQAHATTVSNDDISIVVTDGDRADVSAQPEVSSLRC